MKKFIDWLVLSSKDPQKVSLTIKGILLGVTTYVLFFANLFHIPLAETDLNQTITAIVDIITKALELVAIIMTAWGLARKLFLTAVGRNQVINSQK